MEEVPITLLKSSHAASSSDLFSFGTPENVELCHPCKEAEIVNAIHKNNIQAKSIR